MRRRGADWPSAEGPLRAFLRKTRYTALCPGCADALTDLLHAAAREHPPGPGGPFVPGRHYTMEGGLVVFTEYYHVLRGYCCGSGCRHCAYGNRPGRR